MKVNGLIILIATAAILFSISSLPKANAIGHWLNRIKNRFTSDCSNNYNCDRSEVCREGKCVSACSRERCNLNEGCQITFDHYATCQCLPGFIRDRDGNCVLDSRRICRDNMNCDSSEICLNNECINACYKKSCKLNEACQITNHDSSCVCLPNFVRDPINKNCVPISRRMCWDNTHCDPTEICKRSTCVSACHEQTCKIENETCQVTNYHSFSCECAPGYTRAAFNKCVPICTNNDDCDRNEECLIINNIPTCKCLTGYVPYDPNDLVSNYGCLQYCDDNSNCQLTEKCENNKCVSACGFGTCGIHSQCFEENHIATCRCPDGYIGDPDYECIKACKDNLNCDDLDVCINGNCTDACSVFPSSCGENADCKTLGHIAQCLCNRGYTGDPNKKCEKKCVNDDDCEELEWCDPLIKKCASPCEILACGDNAECYVENHVGNCNCLDGYSGDPAFRCQANCADDNECEDSKKCQNGKCVPVCQKDTCKPHGSCDSEKHEAHCICDPGFIPDSAAQCIKEP